MTSRVPPVVSVVIPTKDRPDLLREALASVRALEGDDLRIEIIVANNQSSVDISGIAAEFGARFVTSTRPGCGATRNFGYRVATGDFIVFLDDDDVFLPGAIRSHVSFLEAHPTYAAVVGQVQLADFHLNPIGVPFPSTMSDRGDKFIPLFRENAQVGATMARMWVRDEIGYFNDDLLSSEDSDWTLRIALKYPIGFVPVPTIFFRQRPMATHDDLQWMRLGLDTKVLLSNYRRGGRRSPLPHSFVRIMLRCRGGFYWYFTQSALAHARNGDRVSSMRSFYRALRSSPLHAVNDLLLGGSFRELAAYVLLNRRPPELEPEGASVLWLRGELLWAVPMLEYLCG